MLLHRKRQVENSYRHMKIKPFLFLMNNVGFCFFIEEIYDKISSNELIREFLQNSGCAESVHRDYDKMSKSLKSKTLEGEIYGKYIQGHR